MSVDDGSAMSDTASDWLSATADELNRAFACWAEEEVAPLRPRAVRLTALLLNQMFRSASEDTE